jgi:hypothetical protein
MSVFMANAAAGKPVVFSVSYLDYPLFESKFHALR